MHVTSETCRICLGAHNLNEIFYKGRDEKIKYCASVQISVEDELPKMICNQCLFYLDIAYVFRTVCETTDGRLRKYFQEKKKKDDNVFYINSPVINEVVIGENEDTFDDEVGAMLHPVETLFLGDVEHNSHITEMINSEHNAVPEIQLFSYNNVKDEPSRIDSDSDFEKNTVPEELIASFENKDGIAKVGRHTARKKSAKCSKRIPTVEDKSSNLPECRVHLEVLKFTSSTKREGLVDMNEVDKNTNATETEINIREEQKNEYSVENDEMMNTQSIEQAELIAVKLLTNDNNSDETTKDKNTVQPKIKVIKLVKLLPDTQSNENIKRNVDQDISEARVQVEIVKVPQEIENEDTKLTSESNGEEQPKTYQCEECKKSFPYKSHLERHSSVHSGLKEFKCSHCDKKFVNHYNLTVHTERHTGNFRYKCNECGQGFSAPSVLKRHMNSHLINATFQCKYCPKKLLHSSSLKVHERMHTSRPSYTCDICLKVFSYTSSLAEHRKTHQSLKGIVCGICGKQFTRKTSLRRHMIIHTPKKNLSNLKCAACQKIFKSKQILIQHLKRHIGSSKF